MHDLVCLWLGALFEENLKFDGLVIGAGVQIARSCTKGGELRPDELKLKASKRKVGEALPKRK